jgi:hypothetical protein
MRIGGTTGLLDPISVPSVNLPSSTPRLARRSAPRKEARSGSSASTTLAWLPSIGSFSSRNHGVVEVSITAGCIAAFVLLYIRPQAERSIRISTSN